MQFFTQYFHLIAIPPLLPIALFFIIGILWHSAIPALLIIFCILLCAIFFVHKKQTPFLKHVIICSFFTLLGAYLHHKELYDYDSFYTFTHDTAVTINGIVIDKNTVIMHHKQSTAVTIAINIISNKTSTYKSNKIIIVHIPKKNDNITVGDTITLFDIRCKKPTNQSFRLYQIKEQIAATIFENNLCYTINNHPAWSLRRLLWNQKKRLLDGISTKLSPQGFQFFTSLFLGNRMCVKNSLETTNEQFKIWGISHFLARSGLHLALFILIWQAIFCFIPLPLFYKQIIITLLSSIYFILTWTSAPFTRSFAQFILHKWCFFTKTPFHLLHYLTIVTFCFLLYCPLYLFFLDFQLSFALTYALAWLSQLSSRHTSQ